MRKEDSVLILQPKVKSRKFGVFLIKCSSVTGNFFVGHFLNFVCVCVCVWVCLKETQNFNTLIQDKPEE